MPNNSLKLLWIGPFFSDLALSRKNVPNQAAAKWSRGLLHGLALAGCEIRVISHCPERRWPRGRVFWQDNNAKWFLDWFPCERVGYLNVFGVKERWLEFVYTRRARRIFKEWKPDFVLCYNSLHSCNVAVMREAHRYGIKCAPIILDGDDPRTDNWGKLLHDNRYANGVIFLSWWMFQNYPKHNIPLLHMDGGADLFKGDCPLAIPHQRIETKCFTLVHTGALDYWRGLDFMKAVIRCCKRQDVRFIFCGKCDKEKRWSELGSDSRVEVLGFLNDKAVDKLCGSADLFLSVREPNVGDNLVNYPSKIPQYLAWGKPIVSTWVPSLSPDYEDILEIPIADTPEAFNSKIDEVLAWSHEKRVVKYEQIKAWFESHKSWKRQAVRLVEFICSIIG